MTKLRRLDRYSDTLSVGDRVASRTFSVGDPAPLELVGTVERIVGDDPFSYECRAVVVVFDNPPAGVVGRLDFFGGDLYAVEEELEEPDPRDETGPLDSGYQPFTAEELEAKPAIDPWDTRRAEAELEHRANGEEYAGLLELEAKDLEKPPCYCRGFDPADPCGHGDTSEGCPKHSRRAREEWRFELEEELAAAPARELELCDRMEEALPAALVAFWRTVADHFPEAETGDLDPHTLRALERNAGDALAVWVAWNVTRSYRSPEHAAIDVALGLDGERLVDVTRAAS